MDSAHKIGRPYTVEFSIPSAANLSMARPPIPSTAADGRAMVGCRSDFEPAAHAFDPIDHVPKSGPAGLFRHLEAGAIVDDLEGKLVGEGAQVDLDVRRLSVLGDVLQGFEADEVDGGLDVGSKTVEVVCCDGGGHRHLLCLGANRRDQSLLPKQRRVDAARQCAQRPKGLITLIFQRPDRISSALWVTLCQVGRQA